MHAKHLPSWEICRCVQSHGFVCSPTASPHRKGSWQRVGMSPAAAVGSVGNMCTWCSATWSMGSSITGTASGTAALPSRGTRWGSQRASLVPLGLERVVWHIVFQSGGNLGLLCVRETVSASLFSSTPFLLQAVLSTALVLVPEECAHSVCSLPVWCLHPPVDGGVVPALPAVCLSALWRMFPETFVSTGAGSVGTCFFLEATKLGLSPVHSSVPATSSQTMSRSLVSTVLGKNLTVPQPLLLPGLSRK